jgi:Na+/melibiose symporter-like transporter
MAEVPTHSTPLLTPSLPTNESVHPIYQEPTRSLSWTYRILFGLCCLATGMVEIAVKQILLANQVSIFDPAHSIATFTVIVTIGAVIGVVVSPLAGAISDRTTSRWGRRRPWIIFGVCLGAIGLILMANSFSFWPLLAGEILVQLSFDVIMSATTAIIPDQVPLGQRTAVSAFVGMSPIVGGLLGVILVARFSNPAVDPTRGYMVLLITVLIIVLPFVLVLREERLPREALPTFSWKVFLSQFIVNPRKHPDFFFMWMSRCLIFLAYGMMNTYLLFYLKDAVGYANPTVGVVIFNLTAGILVIISAIVSGLISKKTGRIKIFVIGGALVMMIAMSILALVHTWPTSLIAAAIFGLGFGTYLSIDLILAVRVLPKVIDRGKDLGLMNIAIFLPLVLSQVIGGIVLTMIPGVFGYTVFLGIAAVFLLGTGLLIVPIKGVR